MPTGNVGFKGFGPSTSSSIVGGAGGLVPTPTKTANYTAKYFDMVMADSGGGAISIPLPLAIGSGFPVAVVKTDTTGTASVTVLRSGSDSIYGLASGGTTSISVRGEGDIYWLVDIARGKWQVIDTFISPSYCDVYNSTQQTNIVTATWTSVNFGGTNSDPDSCFSSPTWTCKKTGIYDFSAVVEWGSIGSGAIPDISIAIWKNGTGTGTLLAQSYTTIAASTGNGNPAFTCSGKAVITHADTINVGVFQDSGSNKNFISTSSRCTFQLNRIGG